MKMKLLSLLALCILVDSLGRCLGQTDCQFTGVNATPEKAIQLHWVSNTNEVYEIDYADSLIDTNTGTITWNELYSDYPSQGTNTFITDDGNYDVTPQITHPKNSPMRFYRVKLVENNTSPTNPTVAIMTPTNGAPLSGVVMIQISASSPEFLAEVKLYIDGEIQRPSDDDSNFVINTSEWLNGNHVLFATAKSESGLEGIPNGGTITYGRSVSSFVNVNFNNLISGFNFSQPFFQPALGETQEVTAAFAANCNWTLQIEDENSNVVRNASGSGDSMAFNWDGTGTGETNIPDGVYHYYLSASTNGEPVEIGGGGSGGSGGTPPTPDFALSQSSELWAVAPDSETAVPFILYPPGFDTNGLTIFEATPSDIRSLQSTSLSDGSTENITRLGGGITPDDLTPAPIPASQSTSGPGRKNKVPVKGQVGNFGILYKTYNTTGFTSMHPTTGWPAPLPTLVAIDGQTRTALTSDYRILTFATIATDFADAMKYAAWSQAFVKADDQWSATDIKKSSLGGNSIFNTCNFGLLMTHGSLGNNNSTGTEDDNIKYTYNWLGANNYVRLSDMDFGSTGTNGLRWMTVYACSILASPNYSSMNGAGKIPVNANLHLLLGPSS